VFVDSYGVLYLHDPDLSLSYSRGIHQQEPCVFKKIIRVAVLIAFAVALSACRTVATVGKFEYGGAAEV
jgi:hypothetical protein